MSREKLTRAIGEIEQSGLYGNQVHQKTLETALTALRSELDRVGCEYCNDYRGELWTYREIDSVHIRSNFCPMCGKKLREDKTDG